MPESNGNNCKHYREQLIERLLESEPAPGPLADHLAACPACRSFWDALTGVQPAFPQADLYTPGLKYRTLKRLAGEVEQRDTGFLALLIPVSFLSLLVWFAIPLVLFTWLFDYWLSRTWFSLLLSTLLLTTLGFVIGSLAFVWLIHGSGSGGDQLKSRIEEILEEFHA
ncbi:MAG: hypothetical protein EHM23_20550 [Acidobacteria bacterium]|nr:MAG: hypothetical protein EHM23_20550 [Acidobacteriota bacterium]